MKYMIDGIDETFWKKVKMLAILKDKSVKDLILDLLHKEVSDSGLFENLQNINKKEEKK